MGLRGLNAVRKSEIASKVISSLSTSGSIHTPQSLLSELSMKLKLLQKSIELSEFGDQRALPKGSKIAAISLSIFGRCSHTLVIGSAIYSAKAPVRLTPMPDVLAHK